MICLIFEINHRKTKKKKKKQKSKNRSSFSVMILTIYHKFITNLSQFQAQNMKN